MSNDAQLKDVSRKTFAASCNVCLASMLRLSPPAVATSSTFFAPRNRSPFFDRKASNMVPVSFLMACWRCKTNACPSDSGGTSTTWPSVGCPAAFALCLGLSVTEIVVPKRECREDAFRAMSRLRLSSTASRRRKFWVGSWTRQSEELRLGKHKTHLRLISD